MVPADDTVLQSLSNGAMVVRIKLTHRLTHYDLVAAALYALREGEVEVTRSSCVRYAKRLLRERGIDGLIEVYNEATSRNREQGQGLVNKLFPEMQPVARRKSTAPNLKPAGVQLRLVT